MDIVCQSNNEFTETNLYSEVRQLINKTKTQVSVQINSSMTILYWQIGNRINTHILGNGRAEYGKQIVATLSQQLQYDYGDRSFSEKNLRRMMQFATIFPDPKIVASLVRQLTWTHIIQLIPLTDNLKRNFYIELCKVEHWSVRTLKDKINSMLYERTAIAKQPENVIIHDIAKLRDTGVMSPELVFHDPYFLDFLGLKGVYTEKDLESAIITELQNFISEFGSDFAFLARQKRITIDNEDYYIDLLFYHRRLRCLVAIDLKLGKFQASYKGQMELYLHWLEKYEHMEGENNPIGLILCAGKNEEHVELMHLKDSNIRVAEYLTILPERHLLEKKLQQAITRAHNRLNGSDC